MSEHLFHGPEISVPVPFSPTWWARPLTVSPNDKSRVHDLGRRLFIGGVKSFQVDLIQSQFGSSVYIDAPGH